MRFSPLERREIGAYLLSFDDSSATNSLGAMEHQRTKYELFLTKPILYKCLYRQLLYKIEETVFTVIMLVHGRIRASNFMIRFS
jgi:hypothetical protein